MTHPSDADALSDYIDARLRGKRRQPTDADSAFAADLLDTAAYIRPDRSFVDALGAALSADAPPLRPVTPTPSVNGHTGVRSRRRQPAMLTWAAVLATVVLLGALVLMLGQPNSIRIQPLAVQSATATPSPTQTPVPGPIVNPLPVLTGGYAQADAATFERMYDSGLRWAGLLLEYRAAFADTLLSDAEAYIEAARAEGLGVLVSLSGSAEEIEAAQGNNYANIAEFAGQLAELGPMAIEVWPEANLDIHWPRGKISGGSYTLLLREVYEAIKGANPSVRVISGAPAPTGAEVQFPGQVMNDDNFYAQMVRTGVAEAADCIGVHYNQGIVPPMATTGDPRQPIDDYAVRYLVPMLQRAATPFRTAATLQAATIPLCVTELGYMSPEGLPGELNPAFAWANNTSVEEQAQWLAEAIPAMAMLSSVRVALVMIWRVDALPNDNISAGYAIIRPDGSCPACNEIGKLQE